MRIDGDWFVGPFECGLVRDMVGIKADVTRAAAQTRLLNPVGDHPHLGWTIAILASNLGVNAFVETDDRSCPDHVVEAKPLADCIGVEPVGCRREHQPPPETLDS